MDGYLRSPTFLELMQHSLRFMSGPAPSADDLPNGSGLRGQEGDPGRPIEDSLASTGGGTEPQIPT